MKLPGIENAVVPREKIAGYLLCSTHPTGTHKAAFFTGFGFAADSWETMAEALARHAAEYEVAEVDDNDYGTRYTVEGPLDAPDGRRPSVRVVWFVERGERTPRLVTAYPS